MQPSGCLCITFSVKLGCASAVLVQPYKPLAAKLLPAMQIHRYLQEVGVAANYGTW